MRKTIIALVLAVVMIVGSVSVVFAATSASYTAEITGYKAATTYLTQTTANRYAIDNNSDCYYTYNGQRTNHQYYFEDSKGGSLFSKKTVGWAACVSTEVSKVNRSVRIVLVSPTGNKIYLRGTQRVS